MENNIKINEIFIENELIDSYLNYAMSVIIGRALPDVRDGLKPVHRRTLFVMKELNNRFDKNYKKSARIVGDVIGKYHPHGEIAVYDSIVRLTQNFIQRYPLINGQGNFGSVDGDSAAAMRYTEIKMAEITEYIIKDLEFDTVDYISNYDNTEKYPSIFPSMFPNILINGSYGIAVGMATNIPPHNFIETINSCIAYINKKKKKLIKIKKYILSPDFPTGGIITKKKELNDVYYKGKGKIEINSKIQIYKENKNENIIINELPYQINKIKLLIKIKNLIKEKKIEGIKLIRDESDKDGLRILIQLEKNKNLYQILKKIYSLTNLQTTINATILCLVKNIPKLLNLNDIIKNFINYRKEIINRRINYILLKIKNNIHLHEALYISLFSITKIISSLKNIKNVNHFKKKIKKKKITPKFFNEIKKFGFFNKNNNYKLSDFQLKYILNLKLSKLLKNEKNIVINNYLLFIKDYFYYKTLIKKNKKIYNFIKKELFFLKKKFKDERKTKIIKINKYKNQSSNYDKSLILFLSKHGYLKTNEIDKYKLQHRKGKGKKIFDYYKYSDNIISSTLGYESEILLCFSNYGKMFKINLKNIISKTQIISRGININNEIKLMLDEKIIMIKCIKISNKKNLIILTKNGLIKSINTSKINKINNNGIKIITLSKNDEIIDIKLVDNNNEIMICSNVGRIIRFKISLIKNTNKKSKGIKALKLKKNEYIISCIIPEKNCFIFTATEKGYAKYSKIEDYKITKKGGRGIISHKINKTSGNLISAKKISNNDNLFIITNNDIILKISAKELPLLNRVSKGVLLVKLKKNEKIIITKIIKEKNK